MADTAGAPPLDAAACMRQRQALHTRYARHGCCRVTNLLTAAELAVLRTECDTLRAAVALDDLVEQDCVVEVPPGATLPDNAPARRDAAEYLHARDPGQKAGMTPGHLVLHTLPAVAAAALTDGHQHEPLFLFNEHYICKPGGGGGGPFRWHTDAAHQLEALVALQAPGIEPPEDYISLWVALDDITCDNGALILLPRVESQPPDASCLAPASAETEHWLEHSARGLLTTAGMRAGDAVLFSSTLWHCSCANTSAATRRAFYVQYSRAPLCGADGSSPLALAVPTSDESVDLGAERSARVRVVPLDVCSAINIASTPDSHAETGAGAGAASRDHAKAELQSTASPALIGEGSPSMLSDSSASSSRKRAASTNENETAEMLKAKKEAWCMRSQYRSRESSHKSARR